MQHITNSVNWEELISLITVKWLHLHIGEFSDKLTKTGHIFCFSAVTFFVFKIEKTSFLAQIGTWCFRRFWALYRYSTISGYRDMWITLHTRSSRLHLRGLLAGKWGQPKKINFQQVLDHFSGFENTLFSISKKFFSLHPTIQIFNSVIYNHLSQISFP